MEAVRAWAAYSPGGTLLCVSVWNDIRDDIPVRIIREEDWVKVEEFLRDVATTTAPKWNTPEDDMGFEYGSTVRALCARARALLKGADDET